MTDKGVDQERKRKWKWKLKDWYGPERSDGVREAIKERNYRGPSPNIDDSEVGEKRD